MRKSRGFTLIELVIVVAIIAILAAIALPSYANYVRRSRRSAAEASIQQIALLEERFRADNSSYTGAWANLGSDPSGTYYTYTVTPVAGPPATYSISAAAKGDQLKDNVGGTICSPLTYSVNASGVMSQGPVTTCWNR